MKAVCKVSIVTISYNHEKYIAQTLDSIVNQVTDFQFEIIIADDASTDSTQAIIQQYATQYPTIVKPILRNKNVGAQSNFIDAIQRAEGAYIALCEGDDYWTDMSKLQTQADYMDAHPKCAISFHSVTVFYENGEEPDEIFPDSKMSKSFNLEGLVQRNFIQTNSVMYRKADYTSLPNDVLPLDWYMHLYHAKNGTIGYIDRVMSAYRRHVGGMWWDAYQDVSLIWDKHGLAHLRLYQEMLRLLKDDKKLSRLLTGPVITMFDNLSVSDLKTKKHLLETAVKLFPEGANLFLKDLLLRTSELHEHASRQANMIQNLQEHERQLESANEELRNANHKLAVKLNNVQGRMLVRLDSVARKLLRVSRISKYK